MVTFFLSSTIPKKLMIYFWNWFILWWLFWIKCTCWGLTISFYFFRYFFELKKVSKNSFSILQGTFYVPFHSTKTADKCWTTCFFPYISISLRCGTQFRSIYRLVLCKIVIAASNFKVIELFFNFKLTNSKNWFEFMLTF